MFPRMHRAARTSLLLVGCLTLGIQIYFLATSPVAFQKSVSIVPKDLAGIAPIEANDDPLDILKLISGIPYVSTAHSAYEIAPRQRYEKTIEQGYGNCSNLAMGLAYLLRQRQQPYQIVHILPHDGFLRGIGHTVMNMPYRFDGRIYTGIVDLYEGGLPVSGESFVDLDRLREKNLTDFRIFPLNSQKDTESIYYDEFLNNSAIGVMSSQEINSYYDFLDLVYLPLGSAKLERNAYLTLALVLGKYPHVYVEPDEYQRLFHDHQSVLLLGQTLLWAMRATLMLITMWGALAIIRALSRASRLFHPIRIAISRATVRDRLR